MSLYAGFSDNNMALTGVKEPLALKRSAKVFCHRINQNPVTGTDSKEKEKATAFPPVFSPQIRILLRTLLHPQCYFLYPGILSLVPVQKQSTLFHHTNLFCCVFKEVQPKQAGVPCASKRGRKQRA